jgi:diguanylate cyclase (GGDEF)-like protein
MSPQDENAAQTQREALALLRAGGAAYYRYADFEIVRRIGAAAVTVVTSLTIALLPAQPPTVHAPAALGMAAAAVLLVAGLATTGALARARSALATRGTLAVAFGAIAGLGLLDALAGPDAPYDKLYVLLIVWAGATHTPRRVAALVVFATLVRAPSLAEAGWPTSEISEACTQVVVWLALAAFALAWTSRVRAHRMLFEREGDRDRALARVDALTGLGNRRAFDEALAGEVARAARNARPLCLLVADLDGFKAINDAHGHLAGDRCLREVAAALRATVRRPDACFRWGGDEFAILLAETALTEAEAVAARICEAVAADGRLSLGYGVAMFDGTETPEALLARADRALLMVKTAAT